MIIAGDAVVLCSHACYPTVTQLATIVSGSDQVIAIKVQEKRTDLKEGLMNNLGVCEQEHSLLAFKPSPLQQLLHVIPPLISPISENFHHLLFLLESWLTTWCWTQLGSNHQIMF